MQITYQREGRVAVGEGARWIFLLMSVWVGWGGGDGYVLVMRFWFQPQISEYSRLEMATFFRRCSDDGIFSPACCSMRYSYQYTNI